MVFRIPANWRHIHIAKNFSITLIFLLMTAPVHAAKELFINTVHVQIIESGELINSGVGLFIGTYENRAYMLLPEHVLTRTERLGEQDSGLKLQTYDMRGNALTFDFADIQSFLQGKQLANAIDNDYMIIAIKINPNYQGLIFDLTRDHFVRPWTGDRLYVYGQTAPQSDSYSDNYGLVADLIKGDITTYTLKSEDIIQTGESGSVVMSENAIHGILKEGADGRVGYVVYPSADLSQLLQIIESKTEKQAKAISLVYTPTYQFSSTIEEVADGVSQTRRDSENYHQLDLEFYSLTSNRAKGKTSSSKMGFLFGYSPSSGHGLGYVDDAEYTLKWGVLAGSVDRYTNNTGQGSLFVLSHKTGEDFEHRLGASFEATWGIDFTAEHAFDVGMRIEINKFNIEDINSFDGVIGIGLVMRYSWITPL